MVNPSQHKKPTKFDNNLIVIGAGAGGLVSSFIAATVKAKVTLIEKNKMGGDCLNTGCVPSKALIRSAKWLSNVNRAEEFGFKTSVSDFEFANIMRRIHSIIKKIEPHDSIERYADLGVEVLLGEARILSPWEVQITSAETVTRLTARTIIIATGARPYLPELPGIHLISPLTSENLWQLQQFPKRLLVLGGGPIGCELAQSFARLGSHVTLVEKSTTLLAREDSDVSAEVMRKFKREGIDIRLAHEAKAFRRESQQDVLIIEHNGQSDNISFDEVIVALGRVPNVKGYGLEELGITLDPKGNIKTNGFQQTNIANIFAVGDVAGPYQFTHTAGHQAWYAAVNALFGQFKKFRTDYSVVPWCTFTDPEVARVGLNEQEAHAQGIPYEMVKYKINDLDRAITDGEAHGFVKVLTKPGKDKILGVTIVGEHAGDLIAEYVLAIKHGLGLKKILGTIHIYPTLAEANKYAAGEWRRAHAPQTILRWIEKYHRYLRG